jgi:hypothetical protein
MLGKAAMIAVLLMPTVSIVRHDDHSTAAKPVRWFNVAASRVEWMTRGRAACIGSYSCRWNLLGVSSL